MPIADFPNLAPALPEIFLACAAMTLLMVGVFQKDGVTEQGVRPFRMVSGFASLMLVLTLVLVATVGGYRQATFGGLFVVDPFISFFKVLILVASVMALIMSRNFLEAEHTARFEYPILMLFSIVGMMMMVSAGDFMSLYLGLEVQSLALYVMAAFQRDDTRATEAGLKYFVLGALASGMLLFGISLIYGFTGSTNFSSLAKMVEGHVSLGLLVGLVFVLAGLAFKVSAVPFHMWTPDVYEGAPTPVTAFFAVAPKLAAMALLVRVMIGPFGGMAESWQQIIVFLSIASMVLGAFAAINQTNIKRLMAYSSIGHVGYALIGLAVGNVVGIRGILVYMAIYLFMNIGTFACILVMRRGGRAVESIDDLKGLSKSHPALALALGIFMFSMSGIPPLAGFFGKFYIFLAAIDAGLYALAVIGVLSSVVGAFYYLRIVKLMYFDESDEHFDRPVPREIAAVILLSAVVITAFFLYPGLLLGVAERAAAALF